jgi:tRNA1Val (adenine37-N6)-methyltransferase
MKFFRFKQFQLTDAHSAMKVGMDAVLLGSWLQTRNYQKVLDVGCGSGLIALMMAQRFASARITGIDIHEGSIRDAAYNFEHSPWANRLHAVHRDFKEFNTPDSFDLIISNPPFFNASLLPPEENRAEARHDISLPLEDLIRYSRQLLDDNGIFALVYPFDREQQLLDIAAKSGLYPFFIILLCFL